MSPGLPAALDHVATVPTELYVGGGWRPATGARLFDVLDPGSASVLASVADASPADAAAALDAAATAADTWAGTPPGARRDLLEALHAAIEADRDRLATIITLEVGKPLAESRGELTYGADFVRWFAHEAVRLRGDLRVAPAGGKRIGVQQRPVGPCLLVTPWNFPFALATRKFAAALAAGCTVVVKPPAEAPLSALAVAELVDRVGFPPGTFNVVTTTDPAGVVEPLLDDRRLRKLSFTGSTGVGRHLLARAAGNVLRTSMELGGNAPFLVFADADLDAAVEGALVAKMRNAGQACTAANRFLVANEVAEEFTHRFASRLGELRIGHGLVAETEVGPLIHEAASASAAAIVDDALGRGARLHAGTGGKLDGAFFAPAVLTDVPVSARAVTGESFSPVVPIIRFGDEDEAVALANASDAGLVAYAYTGDLGRALRLGDRIEAGMVGLNCGLVSEAAAPFGGVKHSGLGREGGFEGIAEYLEPRYLAIG